MRKIICLILALFSLFLSSCSGKEPPPKTEEPKKDEWVTPKDYIDGRYIYYNGKRYDTEERVVTVLCPDPLCDHGESCVMKNAGEIALITEKYIYFRSTFMAKKFTRYDKLNNKYEEFFTAEGQCGYAFLVSDDIYLCASEYEYAETGETEVIVNNAEVIRVIENAESEFEGVAWTDKNGVAYYKSFGGGTSHTWNLGDGYTVHNILLGNKHAQAGEWFMAGAAKWQKDEEGKYVISEWRTVAFNFATGESFEFKE